MHFSNVFVVLYWILSMPFDESISSWLVTCWKSSTLLMFLCNPILSVNLHMLLSRWDLFNPLRFERQSTKPNKLLIDEGWLWHIWKCIKLDHKNIETWLLVIFADQFSRKYRRIFVIVSGLKYFPDQNKSWRHECFGTESDLLNSRATPNRQA